MSKSETTEPNLRNGCCVCQTKNQDLMYYKINSEGGIGLPEEWCCSNCMRTAEPDSRIQRMRDDLYHDDFPEFEKQEVDGVY